MFYLLGHLQLDLSGRPIRRLYPMGPLLLVRYISSLDYESLRYSIQASSRWYKAGYDNASSKRINLRGYIVPTPWEYLRPPSLTWARPPVDFRAKVVIRAPSPDCLGLPFRPSAFLMNTGRWSIRL